jgi:hypothetical protein
MIMELVHEADLGERKTASGMLPVSRKYVRVGNKSEGASWRRKLQELHPSGLRTACGDDLRKARCGDIPVYGFWDIDTKEGVWLTPLDADSDEDVPPPTPGVSYDQATWR